MGHAGMAATAVRYLRSVGATTAAAPDSEPPVVPRAARAPLRAVRLYERAARSSQFRGVLGHFATGVTLVTAGGAAGEGPPGSRASVVSLSLDPPLVAFMVVRTSTTWPRIAARVSLRQCAGRWKGCAVQAVRGEWGRQSPRRVAPAPVTGSPMIVAHPPASTANPCRAHRRRPSRRRGPGGGAGTADDSGGTERTGGTEGANDPCRSTTAVLDLSLLSTRSPVTASSGAATVRGG